MGLVISHALVWMLFWSWQYELSLVGQLTSEFLKSWAISL